MSYNNTHYKLIALYKPNKKMYDRVNDDEELKNNISDFFDILYSILDTDKDDKISHEELRPLLFVMYYTKMTEVHFLKEDPPYL